MTCSLMIVNIVIKEFLDKPVILSGTHRGLNIISEDPATAMALSGYIMIRGQRIGYAGPITFYSI